MKLGTYVIVTLGCKVNQCESQGLAQSLEADGWQPAGASRPVDLCVINTCAVTGKAAMQSRGAVRRAIRENPEAAIAITGCGAQIAADAFAEIGGVDFIIGHGDKRRLPEIVRQNPDPAPRIIRRVMGKGEPFAAFDPGPPTDRARPNLKIQDGCDACCTYCVVPRARGPSRSMTVRGVLSCLCEMGVAGCREVVLTGIHLGRYGQDLSPQTSLASLLELIQAKQPGLRIRLSSIEPMELTNDIIGIVADSDMFCRHFHLPLQSGDDWILKRMGRPYSTAIFEERVFAIREKMPAAAIGVDILVGFPGETQEAFEKTLALIQRLPVSYLHVFPFSPRPGTPAASFPDPVAPSLIKERCSMLRALGRIKKDIFLQNQVGSILTVLVEDECDRDTGLLKGVSDNYVTLLFPGDDSIKHFLVKVKMQKIIEGPSAHGVIVNSDAGVG